MVEHNLAMVRVASSNLVSRSKYGALVKRLYSGLQIRIVQFDSETRLHKVAQVVKLVDTRDLKSLGTYTSVSVRLRPRAPLLTILEVSPTKQKSRTIEICLKIVCSIQYWIVSLRSQNPILHVNNIFDSTTHHPLII